MGLALTFDDGPDRTWTPRLLELLRALDGLAHDGVGPGARRDGAAETIRYVELAAAYVRARGLALEPLT